MPRILDIYAALPSITGKLELEYEGELKGGDTVARELIRTAVGKVYDQLFRRRERLADRPVVRSGRLAEARRERRFGQHGAAARRHPGPDGEDQGAWARRRTSRMRCGRRPPSSFSKGCTRTAASAGTKSAASPPRKSPAARTARTTRREEGKGERPNFRRGYN